MEDLSVKAVEEFAVGLIPLAMGLFGGMAILVIGWIVARWLSGAVQSGLNKAPNVDDTLAAPLSKAVRYAIMVMVIIAALGQMGVETTSLFAVLGAAGLAIGLALQGTMSNVAAGIMLLFLRPLRAGEFIDADGLAGTVVEVGLFTTQLRTFDGVFLSVPNSTIWSRSIKNFSRLPTRRIDVVVAISYGDDVERALSVMLDELRKDQRLLPDPEPQTMVKELADSGVNLNLRCWVNASDYWAVLFDLNRNAKLRLEAEGFTIPFPQRDIHVHQIPVKTAP